MQPPRQVRRCVASDSSTLVGECGHAGEQTKPHVTGDKMNKEHSSKKMIGFRSGKLTVISRSNSKWNCVCDCGGKKVVSGYKLKTFHVKSCGCLIKQSGRSFHPNYKSWSSMRGRCLDGNNMGFKNYGGRGISICERWSSFELFVKDMGVRPSKKHSLGRINNDGNYEPSNCRWETAREQANNRRNNVTLTARGETKTIQQWCRHNGWEQSLIYYRLKRGWTEERACTQPLR